MEEAGIRVGEVAILGSQPWPIGRGGSCELMIGCIGKALSDDLRMDEGEMDEVRYSTLWNAGHFAMRRSMFSK